LSRFMPLGQRKSRGGNINGISCASRLDGCMVVFKGKSWKIIMLFAVVLFCPT
jgi:hypothetical protein